MPRLREMGLLRLMLATLAVVLVVFSPSPELETVRSGWGLIRTGVLPALGPVVFLVLLFDMLMSRVFMSEQDEATRQRYRHILMFDGFFVALILLSWTPFLMSLFQAE